MRALPLTVPAAGLLVSALAASPATAQEPDIPFGGAIVERPAEVTALIDKVKGRYEGIKTYRDTMVMSQDFELAEGAEDPAGFLDMMSGMSQEMEFAWTNERKFAAKAQGMNIASDGTTITAAVGDLGQYRQFPAPTGSMAEGLMGDMVAGMVMQHPAFGLLSGDGAQPGSLAGFMALASSVRHDNMDGRAAMVLIANVPMPMGTDEMRVEVAIDEETSLLSSMKMDVTNSVKDMMKSFAQAGQEMPDIESVNMVMRLKNVKVNEPIDDAMFVVDVDGLKKVESFDFGMGMGQKETPFKPGDEAPAFSAESLAGKTITLADYRGKVVVLDFWATWCGPCVAAIPHVQKVSEAYADRGVVVLGINQDRPGMEAKVKSFVEKKGITFKHAMDPKGEIGRTYRVTGIPTTVVIDRNGVIRSYEVGFRGDDALKKAIEEALALAGDG